MCQIVKKNRLFFCIALLMASIASLVLFFPLPPLLDYPNHLARLWLLAGGVDAGPARNFYMADWQGIATNIFIDLAAKAAGHLVSPFTLGRMLVAAAMLLPPLGAVVLNAKLFDGLNSWQPFFLFFWCSQTMLAGFLNFQMGLGVALLAAAMDPALRRRGKFAACGGRIALGMLIMLFHPFDLLFYCILVGGLAFGEGPIESGPWRPRAWRALAAAAVGLIPVLLFFAWTKHLPGDSDVKIIHFASPRDWIRAILSPFSSYDDLVDLLFAIPLLAVIIPAARQRRFSVHTGLLGSAALLAGVALVMPHDFHHASWLDYRLPIMAVLASLAATRLEPRTGRESRLLAVALLIVGMRSAWIGLDWRTAEPLLESTRQALAAVPPGAAVLPMEHRSRKGHAFLGRLGRYLAAGDETFRHYPAMAIPWRGAYEPMLFSQQGMQPIKVRPAYADIATPGGGVLASVHTLHDEKPLNKDVQYVRKWRTRFDYVLVLNADVPDRQGLFIPPPGLKLVSDQGFAQLFQVEKPAAGH